MWEKAAGTLRGAALPGGVGGARRPPTDAAADPHEGASPTQLTAAAPALWPSWDVVQTRVALSAIACTIWYMNRLFETSRHIDAAPEPVWSVLFDVARWPEWTPTVDSVERLDDGPLRVGSRARLRQPKLPQALWEVTEVDDRSFTWEAKGPGMKTIARHEVVPDGTGSTVRLSIEQTGPMGIVAAVVWRRLTQRYIELEAESLDRRVTAAPAT